MKIHRGTLTEFRQVVANLTGSSEIQHSALAEVGLNLHELHVLKAVGDSHAKAGPGGAAGAAKGAALERSRRDPCGAGALGGSGLR